jgi:lipid II:glycine glycyltransferase (peptidoglycan interpeptide bridge formation enzyme)
VQAITAVAVEHSTGTTAPSYTLLDHTDEHWLAFVASQPNANTFHDPVWINVLTNCYGYRPFVVAVTDDEGQICAGVPVLDVRSPLTGKRWISLPFTDHCMPLYRDDEALERLTQALLMLYREKKLPRLELRWNYPQQPLLHHHSDCVLHTVRLSEDVAAVQKQFHSMHRRNIKTAEKRGVRIEWGYEMQHIRQFYALHLQTRQRQGVPIQPWAFFEALGKMIADGHGFVLLAYKDDACLAAAVFLHAHQTLIYKYGASANNPEAMNLRPNNLIFWHAIRWGCEHGYTIFDMGKTDMENTGLRDFKSKWGAEEIPLIYSTIAAEPPDGGHGRLSALVEKVIHRSPPWVGRVIGELLYKHVA